MMYEIKINKDDDEKTKKLKKKFIKLKKELDEIEEELRIASIVTKEDLNKTVTI